MNNLTNEQIARVFAMYWGCDLLAEGEKEQLNQIYLGHDQQLFCNGWNTNEWAKLLLTPLSAISDGDAVEVSNMAFGNLQAKPEMWGRNYVHYALLKCGLPKLMIAKIKGIDPWKHQRIYQYLIQKDYAVPLFIEVGHPDNGKTAIELGLAIEKEIQP